MKCSKCKSIRTYLNPTGKCTECKKSFCFSHLWSGMVSKSRKDLVDVCDGCKVLKGYVVGTLDDVFF